MNIWDKIFGFTLTKNQNKEEDNVTGPNIINLPEEQQRDGALNIDASNFLQYGTSFDYQIPEDEIQLITKYRDIARQPEVERAIDDIINEAFAYDQDSMPVSINLDETDLKEGLKNKIRDEFDTILHLLNFRFDAYDIFRNWYVDGRLYYHKVVDEKKKSEGIQQLKYIDPRKIRKIRRELTDKNKPEDYKGGLKINKQYEEFYLYNPTGINSANPTGISLSKDSIAYVHSNIFSRDNKTILSSLHKAIRFFNVLRTMEDALVIYRMSRASEKRVFNIEVGDLPTSVAEQQMKKVIEKFRKKLSFNPQTGEILEQKKFITMMEDFWFAKRNGVGTTVDVLSGAENLGELADVDYFKQKLYESLNVPITRLNPEQAFNLGRSSEISRDELKFSKFVSRLRKRFSHLFDDLLRTQLALKNIMKPEEFDEIAKDISYDYLEDNFFSELKWAEIYANRFNSVRDMGGDVMEFVSKDWIRKNILRMTEEEIDEQDKLIAKEQEEAADSEEPEQPPPPPQPVPVQVIPNQLQKPSQNPPQDQEVEEDFDHLFENGASSILFNK